MKITVIAFEGKRPKGDFRGVESCRMEAQIGEREDPLLAAQALELLVDSHLNHEKRKAENDRQLAIVSDPGATDQQREWAHQYIDKYGHWLEQVHAAQDMLEYER